MAFANGGGRDRRVHAMQAQPNESPSDAEDVAP
jgi:hypothetical protein